jgi:antibiotic biosynthesis monooxygenase (ABM) superfamily enzyme
MLGPDEASEESVSILRFRTDHQLQAWMNSTERRDALPHLRSQLAEDFTVITHSTPFGSILRVQDGTTAVTPNWKTAMLVLLVLYPTVMTLSRFLGPALTQVGAQEWLAMWLSQIVSVGLMTWFLMPVVTGWFRRWLDPVDGAGWRVSLIGAGVVVVVYVATLTLFASVQWLQFWDYPG